LVTVAGVKVERLPGMTATHAREAKAMAEKVYPALYVFENSARDVISKVLQNAVGDNWWDEVVPAKVRAKAEGRKADEAKDPWHGKRGAALIDYLDLTDLPSIVSANKAWPHFKRLFGRVSWFQELVNDLNVSRRVAAHMNPLETDDVKNVEAAFRKWAKLLKAKEEELP
jgi:Swt1-like HEPN